MRAITAILAVCSAIFALPATGQQPVPDPAWGRADTIQIDLIPDVDPVPKEELFESMRAGVDYLLATQNENGSWGGHTDTRNTRLACPWPSGPRTFRAASTALCIIGLEGTPMRDEPAVQQAIARAEDFLIEETPKIKPGNVRIIYNGWAHAYVLEAFAVHAARLPKDSERYRKLRESAQLQIRQLEQVVAAEGGWGYIYPDYYTVRVSATKPTSFMTATVFVAFKAAEEVFGLKPDSKVFSRSMRFLKDQRTPAGTYLYSASHQYVPHKPINRHTGSLARSPACDLAIKIYEPEVISIRQLNDDLERLWSRRGWLLMSLKKPTPHESFAQNSGYFVFFGYYYVALCFDLLPESTLNRHASQLTRDIVSLQEEDGSWWDYPVYNYHKFYGTGYCLFALAKAWDVLYGDGSPALHPATLAVRQPQ